MILCRGFSLSVYFSAPIFPEGKSAQLATFFHVGDKNFFRDESFPGIKLTKTQEIYKSNNHSFQDLLVFKNLVFSCACMDKKWNSRFSMFVQHCYLYIFDYFTVYYKFDTNIQYSIASTEYASCIIWHAYHLATSQVKSQPKTMKNNIEPHQNLTGSYRVHFQ